MQTFLPYPSFFRSVRVLDSRRLGKQRVEAFQILNVLERVRLSPEGKIAWRNHPAVKMWAGHEEGLKLYYNFCLVEWVCRGNRNTMLLKPVACETLLLSIDCGAAPRVAECVKLLPDLRRAQKLVPMPKFMGRREFHLSHQSNLLRKDEAYYRQYFPGVPADMEYVWPG